MTPVVSNEPGRTVIAVAKCRTCMDTGYVRYDENHGKRCSDCCQHRRWWRATDLWPDIEGRWICHDPDGGCGFVAPGGFKPPEGSVVT